MSGFSATSGWWRERPRSERRCGRSDGTKYRTSDASVNCTSMWKHVVKSGKAKLSRPSPNIHLLY
jgi:hypothetical protein